MFTNVEIFLHVILFKDTIELVNGLVYKPPLGMNIVIKVPTIVLVFFLC
jgi:hypothetical protein